MDTNHFIEELSKAQEKINEIYEPGTMIYLHSQFPLLFDRIRGLEAKVDAAVIGRDGEEFAKNLSDWEKALEHGISLYKDYLSKKGQRELVLESR